MKLVALQGAIGRIEGDGSLAELDLPFPDLAAYLADGRRFDSLSAVAARRRMPAHDAPLGLAVAPRASVWGIGMNYRSKLVATGRTRQAEPVLFLKAPAAFGYPGDPIVLPARGSRAVDYEGEIAVLVGAPLYEASSGQAQAGVAAVAAANDVTARDVLARTGQPMLAKSYPGFGQLSGVFADVDSLGGPDHIELSTSVNGRLRQCDTSAGMLLGIADLLAHLSCHVVLRPGDVVLTGTPAGTGDETGTYLRPGDHLEVAVGDLPPLVSLVVALSSEPEQPRGVEAGRNGKTR
jgi:2-keto-4-pentenoate hydratase/2-oxohepta-3-ene-1,7-dioic acid hydratase in catechol pathway